jgi:hypothetical protein
MKTDGLGGDYLNIKLNICIIHANVKHAIN